MRPKEFRYRHFIPEVILQCLRWYLRYPISYRQLAEMVSERGIIVDHTTIFRGLVAQIEDGDSIPPFPKNVTF